MADAAPPVHRPYSQHVVDLAVHIHLSDGLSAYKISKLFGGHPCEDTVRGWLMQLDAADVALAARGKKGLKHKVRKLCQATRAVLGLTRSSPCPGGCRTCSWICRICNWA